MRVCFLILLATFGIYGQSNGSPEVQAFVPDLHWLKRVEPVWPAEARSQALQGNVELLVTLDGNGLVTGTEPLTGPPILQHAAAEAVLQWRFQPVIRNGHSVAAITTETVIFHIPGQKLTPESMGSFAEQTAALERISQLTDRFPRSAKQVLADLEQSHKGVAGLERFYALKSLATAAFDAGDLEKAENYATELTQPQAPKDWNYGNAVYYGNMVLGRVALTRDHNVAASKSYLLAAGGTPGSPQLNSFGPNMSLARDLLLTGERDTVLAFFTSCRAFWRMGTTQLDAWTAQVKAGGIPDFGANLKY